MAKKKDILKQVAKMKQGRFTPQHLIAGAHKDKTKYDRKNNSWKRDV